MGNIATAIGVRAEEASIVAELKAGSEEAYNWLVTHYHQPIYSLVYRILTDPADAADTTQEVFLKVFRGMNRFNGECSLKTWLYRIAIHEASNQRRWWFRHKSKETSMEAHVDQNGNSYGLCDTLADKGESPMEILAHEEVRARVEMELKQIPEPYRTTVVLRDIEGLAYEEIAEVLQISLGTVKSRLIRGRDALKKRLESFVNEMGAEVGGSKPEANHRRSGPIRSGGTVMRCTEARPLFSSYLDRAVSGTEMHDIFGHLEQCADCQKEYSLLENTRSLVSSLGRRQPPSDLALKIRVAISSTRSRNSLSLFQRYVLRLENAFQGFMFPATAGVLSAVIFFGVLIVLLVPAQVSANDDVPSTFYTPPRLQISEYPEDQLNLDSPVVIEDVRGFQGVCGKLSHHFRAR